jgi:hypothetical protein
VNHIGKKLAISLTFGLYSLYIVMFILRLFGQSQTGHRLASLQFLAVPILVYLLTNASKARRPALFAIQAGLMLLFLAVEFTLDYWPGYEFRRVNWMVIGYVIFFFAATGGLLGMAAEGERKWIAPAVALYLVMAVLAFVSRMVTGI